MAGFLEHVPHEKLTPQHGENPIRQELAGIRNQTQALFFKHVIAVKHPGCTPNEVSSRDPKFQPDFLALFTDGTREWFDTWWNDTEHTIKAYDDPTQLAQQALEAYRTLH